MNNKAIPSPTKPPYNHIQMNTNPKSSLVLFWLFLPSFLVAFSSVSKWVPESQIKWAEKTIGLDHTSTPMIHGEPTSIQTTNSTWIQMCFSRSMKDKEEFRMVLLLFSSFSLFASWFSWWFVFVFVEAEDEAEEFSTKVSILFVIHIFCFQSKSFYRFTGYFL